MVQYRLLRGSRQFDELESGALLLDEGVAKEDEGASEPGRAVALLRLFRVLRKRRSLEYLSVNGRLCS